MQWSLRLRSVVFSSAMASLTGSPAHRHGYLRRALAHHEQIA
ncbi:hypothetical protein [Nonomuraea helvata]|uniref:Uncharacterized protein n=1 Tax=Nonomuraea helvata TaxID=37484 RepID=A0ABV5S3S2_9ACTN